MEIHELINNIDDITEPSSMENILMFVDYIQVQDEQFIELLMQKLPEMEVTWEQPWYQQCRGLTRPIIANNKLEDHFRTDKLTAKEIRRIHKNWRKFRKHFSVPNNLECFARWKNTTKCRNPYTPEEKVRRFVIAYLARGLERNLYQVHKYVLSHYGNPSKGNYTEQEEKLMEVCFYHNVRNAIPILSKVLGRESRGIYKKLHEWTNGKDETKKMKWTLPIASKLLKLLLKYTGIPLEDLKYKQIDRSIWLKLEKEMDHPYMYIQRFWCNKLHVQIFVKQDVKINKLRKQIAKKLRKSSYLEWRDIRWKDLVQEFPDGFTHGFLYKVWHSVFRHYKDLLNLPLEELIEYALNRIPSIPNRRLRTLTIDDNGELVEIRYSKEA